MMRKVSKVILYNLESLKQWQGCFHRFVNIKVVGAVVNNSSKKFNKLDKVRALFVLTTDVLFNIFGKGGSDGHHKGFNSFHEVLSMFREGCAYTILDEYFAHLVLKF